MKSILGITKNIVGLAPMDGISDSSMRQITIKHGEPDIMYTEFTNVTGLLIAPERVAVHFNYKPIEKEKPLIAQIYGSKPIDFYHVSKIITALGFDGVDINMGCPAKNVAGSGAGAGLIKNFELASEIIQETLRGIDDFLADNKLTGVKKDQEKFLWEMVEKINTKNFNKNVKIPVSVKTRIGYNEPITEKWIQHLSKENIAWLAVHGRTLNQMYKGNADYSELKKAVESTHLPVLVNGDIKNRAHALGRIKETGAFGALIGRNTIGNPWSLNKTELSPETSNIKYILNTMLEHAQIFNDENNKSERAFVQMRKHFGWYTKTIQNLIESINKKDPKNSFNNLEDFGIKFKTPKDLRMGLMRVRNLEELRGLWG